MQLTPVEARVLGSLIEKEITTPEYYPLSLNALVAACNQKSSREPVMTLSEEDVRGALRSLQDADLVSIDHGSRVQRYEHRARTVFHLRRDETALLCLLLLRGPQTVGELRGRSDRLFPFEDLSAVSSALARMAAPTEARTEALAVPIARQPGTKEQRYAHTFGDLEAMQPAQTSPSHANREDLADRVRHLEEEVADLRATIARLIAGQTP
jgi:uncharacterized protein YceH (UPF0502 family)